jgi:hypothetical protein
LNLLTARIEIYTNLAKVGKLKIKVFNKSVDLDNPEVLREIRESKPTSIFWSNVSDYYHPKTFFNIAKQCSMVKNTYHTLNSMNWNMTCFGTMIFDVETQKRKGLVDSGNSIISLLYEACEYKQYFALPPISNPINISSFVLTLGLREAWCKKFFA